MDPLYADLLRERFGPPQWWVATRPEEVDSKLTQGIRRRALSEALDGIDDDLKEVS
jgi:hypothetical protein